MKYLKKDMVKRVIELARECPAQQDFTAEEIAQGAQGKKAQHQTVRAYNDYLKLMGTRALAELTALMWLGQDQRKKPEQWGEMVEKAMGPGMRDVFTVPKSRMGQFLRTGMERLVRASKMQQVVKEGTGRIIVAKKNGEEPAMDNSAKADEQRRLLAGRFVLASFRNQYGEDGLRQLGRMMNSQGFLITPEDRALFGLEPAKTHEDLEKILNK